MDGRERPTLASIMHEHDGPSIFQELCEKLIAAEAVAVRLAVIGPASFLPVGQQVVLLDHVIKKGMLAQRYSVRIEQSEKSPLGRYIIFK